MDEVWSKIDEINGKIFDPALKEADKAFRSSNKDQKLKSKQLKAINQSISCQIENFMRNPAKLIQRTQLNRKKLSLLGKQTIPIEDVNFFDDSDWFFCPFNRKKQFQIRQSSRIDRQSRLRH